MRTPTLIVRLIGIYLVVSSGIALIQTQKMKAMVVGMRSAQNSFFGDVWVYSIVGLVVGVAAAVFAGPLARLLTFDAARE